MSLPFEQIYAEHFRFVWRCLRRLGVGESDTADALQDVFLVVHRKLPEWEGRSKMTTWLFGICMRVAADRRKVAHTHREIASGDVGDRRDERPSASELLDRSRKMVFLEAALDELSLEQRAVFTLFELEEMAGEEIAECLDVPLGTVWSRLRLARESFSAAMKRNSARARFQLAAVRGAP